MSPTTRTLGEGDWSAFWPLLRATGTDDEEPVAHQRYLDLLPDPKWVVFGVELDGQLVGYAAVQDYGPHLRIGDVHRIARLHDVYVHAEYRRAGAGRALMAAVTEWAAQHVRHLEWQAHHERAAPFYERLGFHGEPCPQPDYPTFVVDFPSGDS